MTPEPAQTATPVKRTLRVAVPIDRAFRVLTEKMHTWWPATHHISKKGFTEIVVEPYAGGRWFERADDGEECEWGKVLVWEPPKRIVFSWNLQSDWRYSPDMARASEVSFEFVSEGSESTRVEFAHSHIERHGEGWEKIHKGVDAGWIEVLAPYESLLNAK
jgi:uncharacterized protein YndB with AHSA1/START domain